MRGDGDMDFGVGGAGGQGSATPEASEPRGRRMDHAAGFSALATSRKSALRALWTSWAASRSVTACATTVELGKGDPRLQEAIGTGQRSEFLVRGHDQLLWVLPALASALPLPLDSMANRQARWWLRKGERKSRRKALACGARRSGMWLCPSHLRTTLPFLDSTSPKTSE